MSDSNQPQSSPNRTLEGLLAPYFAEYHREKCYPGLTLHQGKRRMVQINVPAHDLPTLLQEKPSDDNDPDSGKNRPEVPGHAEEIKEYLRDRIKKGKPWVLGTLTANVDPDKIQLIEFGRGICLVIIRRGVKLDITDGQHRKRAIHELIESSEAELIANHDFPITLVLEDNKNQCQTDFRDMADTKPLPKPLLKSFGEFEGQVGIMKTIIERVPMFADKTEKIKNSPNPKKRLIYTSNYIAKLVSCAFTDDPNDELKTLDVKKASDALTSALNQFFLECVQTQYFCEIPHNELTIQQVEYFKDICLLTQSVGLEILGRLLYCAYDRDNISFDEEKVRQLSHLDWSKEADMWRDNVVTLNPNPKNPSKRFKMTNHSNTVKIAVERAKSHLGWM